MTKRTEATERKMRTMRQWSLALLVALTVSASAALAGPAGGGHGASSQGQQVQGMQMQGQSLMIVTMVVVEVSDTEKLRPFEIKDFSFGVENPTTIGSATGGAGAGKVKFNEFTIKKTADASSPVFFKSCASGAHFKKVTLDLHKVDKMGHSMPYMRFQFETVFTTKIDWSGPGDEGPEESITFVYGKLGVSYFEQDPATGTTTETFYGWDQVTNTRWP